MKYYSPETIKTQTIANTKNDIYSAGIIFYELLFGQILVNDKYDIIEADI